METYTCIILTIFMFYFLLYLMKASVNKNNKHTQKTTTLFCCCCFSYNARKAYYKSELIAGVVTSISVFFDFLSFNSESQYSPNPINFIFIY